MVVFPCLMRRRLEKKILLQLEIWIYLGTLESGIWFLFAEYSSGLPVVFHGMNQPSICIVFPCLMQRRMEKNLFPAAGNMDLGTL